MDGGGTLSLQAAALVFLLSEPLSGDNPTELVVIQTLRRQGGLHDLLERLAVGPIEEAIWSRIDVYLHLAVLSFRLFGLGLSTSSFHLRD